ncbi:MAG: LmeA family phospholipid-binding protein [Solirubrobacteraceae bacterium]
MLTWLLRRLIVLAIILAVPIVGCELLARKLVGDAVRSAVRAGIGTSAKVDFGSTPLLLDVVHGRVSRLRLSAEGARIGGLPPLALSASLDDVHLTSLISLSGAIGSLTLSARLPPTGVARLLATPACAGTLPADVRAALTTSPRVYLFPGRVDLLPPRGRAVEARLRPQASGGRLVFALDGLDRAGVAEPVTTLAQVSCARSLPNLPFDMRLTSASAQTGVLDLGFAGTNASFSALG